ncbi:hypothetical protein BDZ97DRAFT_1121758, partial [Flammula alnicola]
RTRQSADKNNGAVATLPSNTLQKIHAKAPFNLRLLLKTQPEKAGNGAEAVVEESEDISEGEDDGKRIRCTFCPPLYRDPIINMMKKRYCAHPVIPSYAAPDPATTKRWAVQSIYNFCVKHELP